MTAPLSKTGIRRLAEAEDKIERGLSTFMEVGTALQQIRDERLYREQHDTFEDYCRNRWRFSARRANQLMDAAEIGTIVPVSNEGQARALKGLEPDAAREVFEEAKNDGDTTAKGLAAARRKVAGAGGEDGATAELDEGHADETSPTSPALTSEGGGLPSQGTSAGSYGPTGAASGPAPSVPVDPALKMHALLSDRRKAVADWLAFDRHQQVMDAMTQEQREDYRSFVHSVWQHASETLDYLDAPSRLKAVQ